MAHEYYVDVYNIETGEEYTMVCTPDVVVPLFGGDHDMLAFAKLHQLYELGLRGMGHSSEARDVAGDAAFYLAGIQFGLC